MGREVWGVTGLGLGEVGERDHSHRETMDFLCLITALHSQSILSEKKQWTFVRPQELLRSNYLVLEV